MKKNLSLTLLLLFFSLTGAELLLKEGKNGLPENWKAYGKGTGVTRFEKGVLRIADQSASGEWGINRSVEVKNPGTYEFVVKADGKTSGAQLVALTGKRVFSRRFPAVPTGAKEAVCTLRFTVPAGCRSVLLYIYGTYKGMPDTAGCFNFYPRVTCPLKSQH